MLRAEGAERVVIVGAGPVGLVAAWSLVRQGVPIVVVERGQGPGTASRASTFHPPTLEFLADLDLVDDLLAMGLRAPTFQYRDRDRGVVAQFDLSCIAADTAYPYRVQCEQDKLCALIAKRLASEPLAGFLSGHEVTDVVAGEDHAGVIARTADGDVEVMGRWVIGADGAHSAVRRASGIAFDGSTYEERFLVVSTRFDFRAVHDDLAFVNYVSDPDEWFVLLRTPDHWRVLFPVDAGEDDPGSDVRIAQRLAGVAGRPVDWMHASSYGIHQRVAATFRSGRVLLAGDAAHINNPLGGMGMNSGLHDAVSLAHHLGRVWHGRTADGALDHYARLRRQVARDIVDRQTRANYERIRDRDPGARQAHFAELAATAADPERHRAYLRRQTLLDSARVAIDGEG
jgi:2-polyprenyl-6-methoxyphenol hydroxylase-like FAD-dependent oxidoreductase